MTRPTGRKKTLRFLVKHLQQILRLNRKRKQTQHSDTEHRNI